MARRRTRAEILADMEDLKRQLAESEEREERRIGKLANKAGLLDLEISDEELAKAFAELAARFRKDGNGRAASQSASRPAAHAPRNGGGAGGRDRRRAQARRARENPARGRGDQSRPAHGRQGRPARRVARSRRPRSRIGPIQAPQGERP